MTKSQASTYTPYLTLHVPREDRKAFEARLSTWKARPSVQKQIVDAVESQSALHISVLYDIHMPEGLAAARALQVPEPLQLQLGKHLKYFDARDGAKTAVTLPVEQATSRPLDALQQTARRQIPNSNKFPGYNPHMTVAYIGYGQRLPACDEAALLGAVAGLPWTQRKLFFVDVDGTKLHKVRADVGALDDLA